MLDLDESVSSRIVKLLINFDSLEYPQQTTKNLVWTLDSKDSER